MQKSVLLYSHRVREETTPKERKRKKKMKKTNKMATIVERTNRGTSAYIERRVFENENGVENVRIHGSCFSLDDVRNFSTTRKIDVWF
jgi:hypothetical protein